MSIQVGVLGATGPVGWQLVRLLDDHEIFEVTALTTDDNAVGQPYNEVALFDTGERLSESVADMTVVPNKLAEIPDDIELLFSALPEPVAEHVEPDFAEAGYIIVSNTLNERMAIDTPLVIPELNPDHLGLIERQRERRNWDGALVKTPACSTITLTLPLATLDTFDIETVNVTTLHGVTDEIGAMDLLGNTLPHIRGEPSKLKSEPQKILGTFDGTQVSRHDISISPSCNRVPTLDGHLQNVWLHATEDVTAVEVETALRETPSLDLPSAPEDVFTVFVDTNRPQPRLDSTIQDGQGIAVGPVEITSNGFRFDCLTHETIRGAAGTSLLNGEVLVRDGYLSQTGFEQYDTTGQQPVTKQEWPSKTNRR